MAADTTYPAGVVQIRQDGNLAVPTGKLINIETGGALKFNGVDQTAPLATAPAAVAAGYKVARGQTTTGSASDTVVTGLATVVAVVASLEDNPVVGCSFASAAIGDQAGTPAAGSILVKTWKPTTAGAGGNPDLVAASTFSKKVNWIAIGT